MDDRIAVLEPHRYISLTTYRRDGRAVATPVWFALDGDRIIIWTDRVAGKAKRIRATGRAAVAPCDMRGKTNTDPIPATGRVLPASENERSRRLITSRYRILKPMVDAWTAITHTVRRKARPDEIFLEINLTGAPPAAVNQDA